MKQPPLLLLNTHQHASDTLTTTDGGVCVRTHTSTCNLFFFISIKVSDNQSPKDLPCMASHRGYAVSKINWKHQEKVKKSERLRETEREKKKQKQNNLSAPTTIPHCHLYITCPFSSPPPPPPSAQHSSSLGKKQDEMTLCIWKCPERCLIYVCIRCKFYYGTQGGCEISHWTLGCPDQTPSH